MESWTDLCRCCLSSDSVVSLFDKVENVKKKFFEITSVDVNEDDGLPQNLCKECYSLVTSAYHFRMQCIKMDKELKVQLENAIAQSKANEDSDEYSQIEAQVRATENMNIDDIAKESMKQLESLIKTEPMDSDDDYYCIVVIANPNDDKESKDEQISMKIKEINNVDTPNIKQEVDTNEDQQVQGMEENTTSFENCIDSFLVSHPKVPSSVPDTILENEEQDHDDDHFDQAMQVEVDPAQNLAVIEESQDMSNDTFTQIISADSLKGMNTKNFIKILTPNGTERTILLNHDEAIKYLTNPELAVKDGEGEPEEVIFCEGEDASQYQILKFDGSELVVEYADESNIATVLQQEDGTFLCDCGEQFEDFADYEKHQYKHNQTEEHTCKLCGKGFETAEILTGHTLLHSVTGLSVNCPFCNQSVKRNTLTQHIKYTHNNKPTCNVCFKTFASQTNLKRHMMIHSGIREFECDICHKRFHQKITMQTHRLTHLNPFTCNNCGMNFDNKEDLVKHKSSNDCSKSKLLVVKEELMKTVKQEVMTNMGKLLGYACSLCKRMFSVESALEKHVESTHMSGEIDKFKKNIKRFECSICGKSCASQAMLVMHERVHTNERPFPCQLCSLRFKTKTHLRTHQLTHTREKKFGCSVCMKFFALKGNLVVHLRTHTGERPYVCSICNEAFIDSKYLKKHKLKKHSIENVPWNKY